jgi:hypothetical protein
MGCNVSTDSVPRPNPVVDYQQRKRDGQNLPAMRGRSGSLIDIALDIHERAKVSAAAFVNSIPDLNPHERRQLRSIAVNRAVSRLSGSTGALTTEADPTHPRHFSVYEEVHQDPDEPPLAERELQQQQQQREQTFYFARRTNEDLTAGIGDEDDGMTTGAARTATNSSLTHGNDDDDDDEEFNLIEVHEGLNEAQGGCIFDGSGVIKQLRSYSPTTMASGEHFALAVFGAMSTAPEEGAGSSSCGPPPPPPTRHCAPIVVPPNQPKDSGRNVESADGAAAPLPLRKPSINSGIINPAAPSTEDMKSQSFGTPTLISILKKQTAMMTFNSSITSFSVTVSTPQLTSEDVLSSTSTQTTTATTTATANTAAMIIASPMSVPPTTSTTGSPLTPAGTLQQQQRHETSTRRSVSFVIAPSP